MEEKRIGQELKFIENLISRYAIKHIRSSKNEAFSRIQVEIIEYLVSISETVYQKDLEQLFNLRKSTISGVLKTMKRKGIIEKIDSKEDSRRKKITLTEEGIKISKELSKEIDKMEKQLEKNINKEDLEVFFEVTKQIKNNLKD